MVQPKMKLAVLPFLCCGEIVKNTISTDLTEAQTFSLWISRQTPQPLSHWAKPLKCFSYCAMFPNLQ